MMFVIDICSKPFKRYVKLISHFARLNFLFSIIALLLVIDAKANPTKEILVSNSKELQLAIKSATPGQVIVMKDGNWKDVKIDFDSRATAVAKVTLRAQTPGKVILLGNSTLTFSMPNLIVEGLLFKGGAIEKGSVINFNSDSCQLTNTAIQDYNPKKFKTNYYWVYFKGNYNRLDHCFLKGKNNMGPTIGNNDQNSRHNRIDHCYIKDITYVPKANGREIMRIWGYGHADETGDDGAYFTIEYNLFEHADGEGVEIVSLKSNYNIVRYNTVRASRGGLVGRRGKYNTFEANFIFGENVKGTNGIRIAGSNHRVVNNYICDVEEDGLRLIAGEYYPKPLTSNFKPKDKQLAKYLQVQNGYFAHNTIVNCGKNGIDIGYEYKDDWPNLQMVLLPENNLFVNNLVFNCKKNAIVLAVQDYSKLLNFLTFKPNKFQGNIVFGGNLSIEPIPSGIEIKDPKLSFGKDGIYRPANNSQVIDSGVASDVVVDMDGQTRDDKKDIGADEASGTFKAIHPLTENEVGPDWMHKETK